MHLRRAKPEDAAVLAELGAQTFIESFGPLYSPADLQAFLADAHPVAYYERVLSDPSYALWLAEREGEAVGYAMAGSCGLPHPEVQSGDGELKRIYLRASAQGAGIGARLFQEALAWLERDGPRTLWIGVWSQNHGAQRLYARHGFEKVGEYDFIVGQQRDHEFILRRKARA